MQPVAPAYLRSALAGTALALTAAAAQAELPDHMARAVKLCLADTPLAARVEALTADGWTRVTDDQAQAAALALAPYKMIFMFMYGFQGEWFPVESYERAMQIADQDASGLAIPSDADAVMVNPAGGTLEISMYDPGSISATCVLVAPGTTEADLGDMLGVSIPLSSYPLPIRLFSLRSEEPDEPREISFLTFTPYAFATHEPAPIIVLVGPEEAAP